MANFAEGFKKFFNNTIKKMTNGAKASKKVEEASKLLNKTLDKEPANVSKLTEAIKESFSVNEVNNIKNITEGGVAKFIKDSGIELSENNFKESFDLLTDKIRKASGYSISNVEKMGVNDVINAFKVTDKIKNNGFDFDSTIDYLKRAKFIDKKGVETNFIKNGEKGFNKKAINKIDDELEYIKNNSDLYTVNNSNANTGSVFKIKKDANKKNIENEKTKFEGPKTKSQNNNNSSSNGNSNSNSSKGSPKSKQEQPNSNNEQNQGPKTEGATNNEQTSNGPKTEGATGNEQNGSGPKTESSSNNEQNKGPKTEGASNNKQNDNGPKTEERQDNQFNYTNVDDMIKKLGKRKYESKDDYARFVRSKDVKELNNNIKNKVEDVYESDLAKSIGVTQGMTPEQIFEAQKKYVSAATKDDLGIADSLAYHKVPQIATGIGSTAWLVNKMSSDKGQQTNAQLYNQVQY